MYIAGDKKLQTSIICWWPNFFQIPNNGAKSIFIQDYCVQRLVALMR